MDNVLGLVILTGLSPRVRGNLYPLCAADGAGGPIPACAGQPCV